MNEEEIKEYLKRTDKLLDKLSGEDKDTLEWLIFGYNQCAKMLYEKENIIKEVREKIHNIWFKIDFTNITSMSYVTIKLDTTSQGNELLEILGGENNDK